MCDTFEFVPVAFLISRLLLSIRIEERTSCLFSRQPQLRYPWLVSDATSAPQTSYLSYRLEYHHHFHHSIRFVLQGLSLWQLQSLHVVYRISNFKHTLRSASRPSCPIINETLCTYYHITASKSRTPCLYHNRSCTHLRSVSLPWSLHGYISPIKLQYSGSVCERARSLPAGSLPRPGLQSHAQYESTSISRHPHHEHLALVCRR
jgi:hypothetical protein